eukprot:322561-Chlamydomonas_euryale.AAC.9
MAAPSPCLRPPSPPALHATFRAQRCKPSVVHIACSSPSRNAGFAPTLNPDSVPRNFGSGFVWDKAGHVVTNYHVSSLWLHVWRTAASGCSSEAES